MRRSIRRRRLEAKTDYSSRVALLTSKKPRLVLRKTNKYIIVQLVESEIAQDKIIMSANSKELISKGWPKENAGSLKNRAAAYLTGYLLGSKAKDKVKECIADIGMYRNVHKSRIYAALKGAIDSGLRIPHSSEALPEMEIIWEKNEKLKGVLEAIKKNK